MRQVDLTRDASPDRAPANAASFIRGQKKYFATAYARFEAFGGPSVYFHRECLRAAEEGFLSRRHIETLYATLAAWGLHRMGDPDRTKTKLKNWEKFSESITKNAPRLEELHSCRMLDATPDDYCSAVERVRPVYETLALSMSDATLVVNSKALHHILPELIPPIDRHYTMRFLTRTPDRWRDSSGKFRPISLPSGKEEQFGLFLRACCQLKRLADRVDPALFDEERRRHQVPPPKALDNAIVNYVRIVGKRMAPKA